MKKQKIFGLLFIALSAAIIILNANITGAVIGTSLSNSLSFAALVFFVVGTMLILSERQEKESELVKKLTEELKDKIPRGVRVFISKKALERAKTDNRVNNEIERYENLIRMITNAPKTYQQERLGEFKLSPQGKNPLRVVWHYDQQKNIIFIDDFLYHINQSDYVDHWDKAARKGQITLKTYADSGFVGIA